MFWTHGSAAASAKRTEIRRAAPLRGARHGVSKQGHYSRKLKQLLENTSRSRRV